MSYSQKILGADTFWGALEGTHLLMLMLFFGTILFVDLRLLGLTFRRTPVSVVSDKILPLTVVSMIIVLVTGVLLFWSKPEEYFHNFWFRLKMIFLVLAMINIAVFHKMIQKNQAEWDAAPSPPSKAKIAAVISLVSWIIVIACGRFIAYNWLECGKPHPGWINAFAGCSASSYGSMTIEEGLQLEIDMKAAEDAYEEAPAGAAATGIFADDFDPAAAPAADEAAQPEAQ